MAIGATCVWEVRASGASDNNGGGYIPGSTGTDFSQQNSPQYALSAIASSGSGNTFLTAAAAADMVGNILQVISGTNFTTGFFQITSVSVGVSVTCAVNNASASICTGVGASGVINIGGALATITKVITSTGYRPSNTVYCTGTFTTTAALVIAVVSTGAATNFIGYGSVRGDNGASTWTTSTNSINLINISTAFTVSFFNLTMSSTAGTRGDGFHAVSSDGNAIRLVNCTIDGFNIGINGKRTVDFGIDGLFMENCEVKNCISTGIYNTFWTSLFSVFMHGNGAYGFELDPNQRSYLTCNRCIAYSNGSGGIRVQSNGTLSPSGRTSFIANSIFSTNTGAGILTDTYVMLVNNICDRNTTYGIDFGSGASQQLTSQWNNAFYNNTTAARRTNGLVAAAYNDITLSADPYTSVGTDFSLNSTAGGGAAVKGAGFPGVMIVGGTGFASPGALDPTTGGGGTTIVPGKTYYTFLGKRG